MKSVRPEAPYLPNNVQYIANNNGLESKDDVSCTWAVKLAPFRPLPAVLDHQSHCISQLLSMICCRHNPCP